jgi:hypothetical protein
LTQGVSDLSLFEARHFQERTSGAFVDLVGQKAIVLPAMTLIMPRPVSAKGNFIPVFYKE